VTGGRHERAVSTREVIAFRADLIEVAVESALPPGSRVRLTLDQPTVQPELALAGKVVGIERADAGGYRLRVRLHSLPRDQRQVLEALVSATLGI